MDGGAKAHFFISRTGADKGAANLIAETIHEAGLTTFYQDEDFGPSDFMRMMEMAYECERAIVLLSGDYQKSEYCRKEYNTLLKDDPANLKKRVIVFRVDDFAATGNLATLASTNLVPVLNDRGVLRRVVRVAIGIEKHSTETAFAQSY